MSGEVIIQTESLPSPEVSPLSEAARAYAGKAVAANTKLAYGFAWADFTRWCEGEGEVALPAAPETVGNFLAERATSLKVASLNTRLAAIQYAHRLKGCAIDTRHPAIRAVMQGIRNAHTTAPTKKAAVLVDLLRDAVAELAQVPGPRALRDRAMLLVGFAAALRRSELVAIDAEDVQQVADGIVITLRRRKTDQVGSRTEIAIPFGQSEQTCPVLALRAWMKAANITTGPLFVSVSRHGTIGSTRLSPIDVARAVKAAMGAADYDPALFSGHSLRSGFITSAARAGVAERDIQNQSGHCSLPVLRGYIRRDSLFIDNAAGKVGL